MDYMIVSAMIIEFILMRMTWHQMNKRSRFMNARSKALDIRSELIDENNKLWRSIYQEVVDAAKRKERVDEL